MADGTEATLPMDFEPGGGRSDDGTAAGLLLFWPLGAEGKTMRFAPLGDGEMVLGRAEACDLRLDDPRVSRRHALLRGHGGHYWIDDVGSTSGVWVNGRPVHSVGLSGGEVVRLGKTLMRFVTSGPDGRTGELPVNDGGPMVAGPGFLPTRRLLDRAANSDLSVLITGETGTGKELAARHLHQGGELQAGPFVPVNCSAIPAELFESELFGHSKGAFTGASSSKPGYVRQAHGGTLFLDEIGELPPAGQAKLLRVLQDRRVFPVGASEGVPVRFRLVSATNRDLDGAMADETFRTDLFARVAELRVRLPALRQRLEEIPLLVAHFLHKHGRAGRTLTVSVTTLEQLCLCPWPMNIRQLESAVRRAIFQLGNGGERLSDAHFAEELQVAPTVSKGRDQAAPTEQGEDPQDERLATELTAALKESGGNATAAAGVLGISRSQIYRRAQKLGIDVKRFRR